MPALQILLNPGTIIILEKVGKAFNLLFSGYLTQNSRNVEYYVNVENVTHCSSRERNFTCTAHDV